MRVLIKSPTGIRIEHVVHFGFTTTNNEAEYKSFLVGAKMTTVLGANVVIWIQLVARQITGEFTPKEDKMSKYKDAVIKAMISFKEWKVVHLH